MPENSGRVKSVQEVATHFGVNRRTVHEWFDRGAPEAEDGFYDLEALAVWRAENVRPRLAPENSKRKKKFDHWHTRAERAKALAAEEALRVNRGELVETDWVSRLLARHVATHNALFESLSDRVLASLPTKTSAHDRRRVADVVTKLVNDLRTQMVECVEEWTRELREITNGEGSTEETSPADAKAG